jgi:hypothetical protein
MTSPTTRRTRNGFAFGAAEATALCTLGTNAIIRVRSPSTGHFVDVRVTKTGQLRVSVNGLQCAATKGRPAPDDK